MCHSRWWLLFVCTLLITLAPLPAISQQVIATVPVGHHPQSVAVNPATNKIYVTNRSDFTVTVIDGLTNETTTVGVGLFPIPLAVNSLTNKIYVGNYIDNTVTVIDGATNNTTTVNVGVAPDNIAVNPVTNKIYVVNDCGNDPNCASSSTVSVIDGVSGQVTATITVGAGAGVTAVDTATNKIYVTNYCGNDPTCASTSPGTVTVIDGETNNTTTLTVGKGADGAAVNVVTNKIYVADNLDNTVTVIDGATNGTSTIRAGVEPGEVAVNGTTNRIYVGNFGDNTVTVINGDDGNTTTVPAGNFPLGVVVDEVTNKIYVDNRDGNTVTAIDGVTNMTTTVAVGNNPVGMALNQATNRVYVGNFQDNTVSVIAGAGGLVLQFIPVAPCRVVDTRNPNGQLGGPSIQGGTSRSFALPQGSCNIPPIAGAYSLNVTAVPHRPLGYLTIWPTGENQPLVSTMNSQDGRVKANAAIVPAGTDGAVSVYVTDTSDVILDIDGYFAPATQGSLQFYPLTPCRVVDTRQGSQQPQGLGPPSLGNMETRELPILGTTCAGLPANPAAYSFNATVVPHPAGQSENYITLWPSDQTQPLVSTLNNYTATVVANAAIVPAAANGDISVYAYNSTDVIMDINGYFAAPGQGGLSFYPTTPCRAYDSRNNNGQPFQNERTVDIVGSPCAPPSTAQAYVFNATVVPSPTLGYLTLWADSQQQPVVSTLNAYDGFVTSNMAIVPNVNGSIDAYAAGLTQLILDISGYFAP